MNISSRFLPAAALALGLFANPAAQAGLLTFGSAGQGLTYGCQAAGNLCGNLTRLLPSYGDIAGLVDVSTHSSDGGTLSWYSSGYNELYGVAYNNVASSARPAWVDLAPLGEGDAVTLTHFDLGGYFHAERKNVTVSVLALGSDELLWSYTGTIGSNGGSGTGMHTGFDLDLSSYTGLRIEWSDPAVAGNVGIDNISYEVGIPTATVPEPGSLSLVAAGLAAVAWLRRRVRQAGRS